MKKANKNKLTLGVIAAISATLLATTSDVLAAGHNKHSRVKMMFKRLDADNNRAISLEELTAPALTKAENKFTRRDTDADGFLTFEEMTAGKDRPDLSAIADEIVECVADIKEQTGNEHIVVPDPSVFKSAQQKFDDIDSTGDGVLDLDEVTTSVTNKVTNRFATMDTDGIDDVSFAEFKSFKHAQYATRRAVKACVEQLTDDSDF